MPGKDFFSLSYWREHIKKYLAEVSTLEELPGVEKRADKYFYCVEGKGRKIEVWGTKKGNGK